MNVAGLIGDFANLDAEAAALVAKISAKQP